MTTSVRSLAGQPKFARIFFSLSSFLLSLLLRTTKIRQNFFVPSAHSIILDTSVSSLYGSTRLDYPYPHRSRLSFLFSPIDYLRLNPSSFCQPSFLRTTRPLRLLPSILPSRLVASTSCPRQSLFLVLGPLGCAVYPMLTVGLTCTQLSRPFSSWVLCS
jgi:hypothetical protein